MRNRVTKEAMGLNDCPTTMVAPHANPPAEKYMTGDPASWAETPDMRHPWDEENAAGREPSGHPKMKATYATAVREAKELEAKAMRCLKLAEVLLPESPVDAIERQAVDFMTMSNKSVLSTLRRLREFEDSVSESRVAKIVDAVLEVIAEEKKEEEKEEKKAEEVKVEEKKEEEVKAEEKKEEEKKEASEDEKLASIIEAVIEQLSKKEEEKEEKKEKKAEEVKVEEKKEEEVKAEEKKEEVKEEVKAEEKKEEEKEEKKAEEVKVEEKKEEEKKEEKVSSNELNISFDDLNEVMASEEDEALLTQLFTAEEEEEEKEEKKEAKIQSLKNVVMASKEENEVDKLSSLWNKE